MLLTKMKLLTCAVADAMYVFETNVLSQKKLGAMNVRGYVAPLNAMNVTKTHPDRKGFPFVIK